LTFLYSIFLAALAAASIPILLHILNRYRLPLVEFSSLQFLQKLQKRKARRVKLRQIILLLIRTLALIALVLVFARPALQSGEATGSAASVEMVIVLDEGITSSAESKDGQLLKLSVQTCLDLVDLAGRGDRITLIPASSPQRAITVPTAQRELIVQRLEETVPRFVVPDIDLSLAMADSILDNSDLFNRELYLVSPFYGSAWDTLNRSASGEMTRCFILPTGPKKLENLVVTDVKLKSSILQKGEPIELEALFRNYSERPVQDALISVYLEEDRVAQASIDLPAEGTVSHSFSIIPERSGLLAGKIKCEDIDPLVSDSRRYFILNIPDSIRVLCIAPDPVDSLVLNAALTSDRTGLVDMRWGDPARWETSLLAGYDVLILAGVESVTQGAAERIGEFSEQGGGVIIFQGIDSDLAGLSRGLWRRLGFSGARETIGSGNIVWGKIDLEHPIFSGMFDKKGSPRSPAFRFAIDLATGKGDRVIVPLANGRPFLLERQVGHGKALMFAVTLNPESSDFIYTGIIAPLIFRAVGYVISVGDDNSREWTTGYGSHWVLPLSRAETAQLETPDGNSVDLSPRPVVGGVEYAISLIEQPGVYNMRIRERILSRFAANVSTTQSNLYRIDLSDLTDRLDGAIVLRSENEALTEEINAIRFGRELWRPITALFLILLVSESLIGRAWRRRKD